MPQRTDTEKSVKDQIRILSDVLDLETKYGFNNSAVIGGGLDQLWQRLSQIAPNIRNLPPMNGRLYSVLTIQERRAWIETVRRRLSNNTSDSKPQPSNSSQANTTKTPTQPTQHAPITNEITLDSPVDSLRFIHYRSREQLKNLDIITLRDALWHFPLRHIDQTKRTNIIELELGIDATVAGHVVQAEKILFGVRNRAARIRLRDQTGYMNITWFNMPYMAERWKIGDQIILSGKVGEFRGTPTMENPEYEDITRGGRENKRKLIHAGAVVPIYPLREGLSQRTIRTALKQALDHGMKLIHDHLPEQIRSHYQLMTLSDAIQHMHYPANQKDYKSAINRLAFDECFFNQILALRRRAAWKKHGLGIKIKPDANTVDRFLDSLDFQFTQDQINALRTILDDIGSGTPMARLLQGEVGSGKTVVAIAAMLSLSVTNGKQAALMAPTEVLAEQHFLNLTKQIKCEPMFGTRAPIYESAIFDSTTHQRKLRVGLLTGSLRRKEKENIRYLCRSGEIDLIVGTHALLQEQVDFSQLALVIVDEQQRFGTEQRAILTNRRPRPHLLAMSATPIPRTLHMTMYGDMDISTLKTLPQKRKKTDTRWANTPLEQEEAFTELRQQIAEGRQAFIVCPLIDPSENVPGASAVAEYNSLTKGKLAGIKTALLHGRMTLPEKQDVMDKFRAGNIDVLIATPVIEVGVDIPNATVMIIMTAEQFGLSQLHQIRGRVGRGEHPGLCILVSSTESQTGTERIKSLVDTNDGFKLAAKDLKMRGPGRNLQEAQSGWSGWQFAHFDDLNLLRNARAAAEQLLKQDPNLNNHLALRKEIIRSIGKTSPSNFA